MQLTRKNKTGTSFFNYRPFHKQDGHNRNKPKSMNFEAYAGEGNRFIYEVARELGTDRDHAARITRAVLHAVRDRLPADVAIQFAQGLPMALKGIFIDRYDVSKTPVIIRSKKAFIEFVHYKGGLSAPVDFPDPEAVEDALHAVFRVLENHMNYGQIHRAKNAMNLAIVNMINGD